MTVWYQIMVAACVAVCAGLTLFVTSLSCRITRLREDITDFSVIVPRGLPGERGPPGEPCLCKCAQKAKAEKMNKAGVAYACQHTDSAGNQCLEACNPPGKLCDEHDGSPQLNIQPSRKNDDKPLDSEGSDGDACWNLSGSVMRVKVDGKWIVAVGEP